MRIVGGSWRGRRLRAPPGRALRPTADRVRESIFNLLAHRDFGAPPLSGASVVDLFAGTGALGLEALSRGAAQLIAVESERAALAALEANIRALEAGEQVTTMAADATRLPLARTPCAYAFVDPPYGSGLAAPALESLARGGWLAAGAIVVLELGAKDRFEPPPGFSQIEARRYGAARIVFLKWTPK